MRLYKYIQTNNLAFFSLKFNPKTNLIDLKKVEDLIKSKDSEEDKVRINGDSEKNKSAYGAADKQESSSINMESLTEEEMKEKLRKIHELILSKGLRNIYELFPSERKEEIYVDNLTFYQKFENEKEIKFSPREELGFEKRFGCINQKDLLNLEEMNKKIMEINKDDEFNHALIDDVL